MRSSRSSAERRRWEAETWRVAERAPSRQDIAARDATFARWHEAVDAVRAHLRTPDGQFFLDALEGPLAMAEDRGRPDGEGPVPDVDVMLGVFARLGEDPPPALLADLVAADAGVRSLPSVTGLIEVGAQERVRTAASARLPELVAVRAVVEDDVHRAFREAVHVALDAMGTTGVVTPQPDRALSSVRWWPGRRAQLATEVGRRTDPLGLNDLFRHLEAFAHSYPAHVYEAAERLHRLDSGTDLAPVEPVAWILSALRHLAARMDAD